MSISLDQMKELVLKNIEGSGFMDNLRSQLKLQVYKIIDSEDDQKKDNIGFKWENPMLKQLNSTEDGLGLVALEMIIEFLEFYKFDYTIPVLRKEAHYIDPIIRPRLAKKMNVQGKENTLKPLLLTMVQEYNKILDEGLVVKQDQKKAPPKKVQEDDEETKQKKKELEWKKQQEKQREDERKRKEEEQKKKQEEKKQQRPQTAPVEKKEPAAVNKIRGTGKITGMGSNLSKLYGLDDGQQNDYMMENDPLAQGASNPYAFDLDSKPAKSGGGGGKDPYAFSLEEPASDPYAFDLNSKPTKNAGNKDPYAFDLDNDMGQKKNKFNTYEQKRGGIKEEIEEDIDDFGESRGDNQKQSNQMFTSSEDYMKATQSLGVDESVDSLALEEYDYYEEVSKKKR